MNERCPKCNSLLIKSNIIKELCSEDATNSALKNKDVILEIDEAPVENFQHISQHKCTNGLVTVKVLRNNQTSMFLVPDNPGFFTDEISYEIICKKCQEKKRKIKKTNTLVTILVLTVILLSMALGFTLFSVLTSKKVSPFEAGKTDVLEKLSTMDTEQEIQQTDYSARIEKLIKASNLNNDDELSIAKNCKDAKAFETVHNGKYEWRKMFILPDTFQVLKSVISGYTIEELEKDRLEIISRLKAQKIGTIYFDYGEWLAPSPKYPGRSVLKFGQHEYDDKRLYETTAALANILAIIPKEHMEDAFFIIDGHTDSISAHSFNQALSERRASYIKYILIDIFNIPEEKIITKGFSFDNREINPEKIKVDFARNRRCEIQVCFFEIN